MNTHNLKLPDGTCINISGSGLICDRAHADATKDIEDIGIAAGRADIVSAIREWIASPERFLVCYTVPNRDEDGWSLTMIAAANWRGALYAALEGHIAQLVAIPGTYLWTGILERWYSDRFVEMFMRRGAYVGALSHAD